MLSAAGPQARSGCYECTIFQKEAWKNALKTPILESGTGVAEIARRENI